MCLRAKLQRDSAGAGISWGLNGCIALMLQRNGFLQQLCCRGTGKHCVSLLLLKEVNESACFGVVLDA